MHLENDLHHCVIVYFFKGLTEGAEGVVVKSGILQYVLYSRGINTQEGYNYHHYV